MAFSEAKKQRWHADRRAGRGQDFCATERSVCGHCGNAFPSGTGVVIDGFSICDVCNGD